MPPYITCRRLDALRHRVDGRRVLYVPHDIWLCIASFLPIQTVRNLYSVNSSFFEIAMDARYRRVDLQGGLDTTMSRKLDHIKDQHVSTRIRSLHIRPWHIADVEPPNPTYFTRLRKKVKRLVDPEFPEQETRQLEQRRVQSEVKAIMDVVKAIKDGVTEYFLDWDEQPLYHALFFSLLLLPLLRDVGQNLRKLIIKVPVEKFRALIPSDRKSQPVVLRNLKELELTLCTGNMPKGDIDESLDVLILFIHNLPSTVQSLSITTTHNSTHLDLSRFFHFLGGLSHLRSFTLSIPADGTHLSDVSKLQKVLHDHCQTLRSLTLINLPVSSSSAGYFAKESGWIPKVLANLRFAELETLHVSLMGFRRRQEATKSFLRRFAPTLTTLVLVDHLLTFEETSFLLGPRAFGGVQGGSQLLRLRFGVTNFCPQLLDLIVHTHPHLEQLDVVFDHLNNGPNAFDRFVAQMYARFYQDSRISHVRLRLHRASYRAMMPPNIAARLRDAFQACLPQLEGLSFVCGSFA